MRKLFITLSAVLASSAALAQGTINFNNRIWGSVDAPFWLPDSMGTMGLGAISGNRAQLYRVTGSPGSELYTPIGQATTFRTPTAANPWVSAYVDPIPAMVVDGLAPGSQITVVLRASTPLFAVRSSPVTITLGGRLPSGEELPPAILAGLAGSVITASLPPMFFSVSWQSNEMHFAINPFQSGSYALESSTDFVTWTPVLTNQTQQIVTIPFQSSAAQRVFFRTRRE